MILNKNAFERDVEIDHIFTNMKAPNKKFALNFLADVIAQEYNTSAPFISEELIIHEVKSTSGIGDGIAIPAPLLGNIRKPITIIVCLDRPIEFDSLDDEPVDLICLVASPLQEKQLHLRRLSRITRLLRNQNLASKIRETSDPETIRALIHNPDGWMMAA